MPTGISGGIHLERLEQRFFLSASVEPCVGALPDGLEGDSKAIPTHLLQQDRDTPWVGSAMPTVGSGGATYYAAPDARGDGLSASDPFRIWDFWQVAQAGDTLILLDGHYTGVYNMIMPDWGLSGTAENRITLRAQNEGRVNIDGEDQWKTVTLFDNDYFTIEGINAYDSSASVVSLNQSDYCEIRRVCAWNAADANTAVIGVHEGNYNLIEDCAAWGTARKIYSCSQGGNNTTFRRCFGRWEGSHVIGPKMVFSTAYNSYNNTFENCVGTWDGLQMQETYTLLDYDGTAWDGDASAGEYTNYEVQAPFGVFAMDRQDGDLNTGTQVIGCVAYTTADQNVNWDDLSSAGLYWNNRVNDFHFSNCLAYTEHDVLPWALDGRTRFDMQYGGHNVTASDITGIGPRESHIRTDYGDYHYWDVEDTYLDTSPDAMIAARGNLLQSVNGEGAGLMNRYENRQVTGQKLLSWPMDERITQAMIHGGYTGEKVIDVTDTLLNLGRPGEGDGPATRAIGNGAEARFTDAGQRVMGVSIDGAGSGLVYLSSRADATTVKIHLDGTTDGSQLVIDFEMADGSLWEGLEVRGSLKNVSIPAANVDLTIHNDGQLSGIVLRDVVTGQTLTLHANTNPGGLDGNYVDAALPPGAAEGNATTGRDLSTQTETVGATVESNDDASQVDVNRSLSGMSTETAPVELVTAGPKAEAGSVGLTVVDALASPVSAAPAPPAMLEADRRDLSTGTLGDAIEADTLDLLAL